MSLRALLAAHPLAMAADQIGAWIARAEGTERLVLAGMAPMKKWEAAVNGQPTVAVDVVDGVAWIDMAGVLLLNAPWWAKAMLGVTDYGDLATAIRSALSTPKVQAIALRCDSPGGSAMGLESVGAAIAEAQATGIPVTCAIDGLCCSAAYWLACCCDRITATPDSLVGCIGTYTVLTDTTAADAKAGVAYTLVSSGGVKGHGADGRITEALRAETQAMIDAYAGAFRARVAAGRDLAPDAVAGLATGASWLATAAEAKGLVDAVEATPGILNRLPAATAATTTTATASATANPPAATPATTAPAAAGTQESPMDVKTLAALKAAHPARAALILDEAGKDGATEASIKAAIAAADQADQAAAATKAQADLATERTAHEATKASLKATQDELTAIKNTAGGGDPGQGLGAQAKVKVKKSELGDGAKMALVLDGKAEVVED